MNGDIHQHGIGWELPEGRKRQGWEQRDLSCLCHSVPKAPNTTTPGHSAQSTHSSGLVFMKLFQNSPGHSAFWGLLLQAQHPIRLHHMRAHGQHHGPFLKWRAQEMCGTE